MSTRRRSRDLSIDQAAPAPGGPDKRADDRVMARLQLDMPSPDGHEVRRVYTRNISPGGLMFRVQSPVKLPGSAEVVLMLPGDRRVTLKNEIRHAARVEGTNEVDVGVQFKAVPPEVDAALRAALVEVGAAG